MSTTKLYTVKEVADILNISVTSVRRFIWGKKIPSVRIGRSVRIARADLDRILLANRTAVDPEQAFLGAVAPDEYRSAHTHTVVGVTTKRL